RHGQEPGDHPQPARDALPRPRHPGRPVLRGREPAVLRHRGRQGEGRGSALRLTDTTRMVHFDGDKEFPQAPADLWARLTDAHFLVQCLPDVETVKQVEADRAECVLRPGFSFVRGTLEISLAVAEKTPSSFARLTSRGKGIGSTSTVEVRLAAKLICTPRTPSPAPPPRSSTSRSRRCPRRCGKRARPAGAVPAGRAWTSRGRRTPAPRGRPRPRRRWRRTVSPGPPAAPPS